MKKENTRNWNAFDKLPKNKCILFIIVVPSEPGNPCLQKCVVFPGGPHLHLLEDQLLLISCGRPFLLLVVDADREEWKRPEGKIEIKKSK